MGSNAVTKSDNNRAEGGVGRGKVGGTHGRAEGGAHGEEAAAEAATEALLQTEFDQLETQQFIGQKNNEQQQQQ